MTKKIDIVIEEENGSESTIYEGDVEVRTGVILITGIRDRAGNYVAIPSLDSFRSITVSHDRRTD